MGHPSRQGKGASNTSMPPTAADTSDASPEHQDLGHPSETGGENEWHRPGQSLGWWPASFLHPFSAPGRGRQLSREAACVPVRGAGLSALHRLLKAKHPTNSHSLGAPGVPPTQSCSESCPDAGQWCCHSPYAGGSRPLRSLQHSLQRAHQVTLSAPPAPPPRIKGQLGFTPRSCSNKGSPMLRTGSVQTEQTGSAQRHSVAALRLQSELLGAPLWLPALR